MVVMSARDFNNMGLSAQQSFCKETTVYYNPDKNEYNYLPGGLNRTCSLYYDKRSKSSHFMNPFATTYHQLNKALYPLSVEQSPFIFSAKHIPIQSYSGEAGLSDRTTEFDISKIDKKSANTIIFAARDILFRSYLENATINPLSAIGWSLPVFCSQVVLRLVGNVCLGVEQIFYGMKAEKNGPECIVHGTLLLMGDAALAGALSCFPVMTATAVAVCALVDLTYKAAGTRISIERYESYWAEGAYSDYQKNITSNSVKCSP